MNAFPVSLLGAIGLHMARERFPGLEREIHRSAHNAFTSDQGGIQKIIHLSEVAIGDIRLSCNMILKNGDADLLFNLDTSTWQMSSGRLWLKDIPESFKMDFASKAGSTLGQAGAILTAPWESMRYTGVETGEDHDEYDEGPPWFALLVSDLSSDNRAGVLAHDGLRTWTGDWT